MKSREDFFKKNDEKLLPLGFKRIESDDPFFFYEYPLIQEKDKENYYDEDDMPRLLIGRTPFNNGACLCTGDMFVWIGVSEIEEAIEWANKIVAFEQN